MASIINASSTGSGGIVQTADASGVLQLQTNGTVALTLSGGTAVAIGPYTNSSSGTFNGFLQVGANTQIMSFSNSTTNTQTQLTSNAYYNGGYKAIAGGAGASKLYVGADGVFSFSGATTLTNAGDTITFTDILGVGGIGQTIYLQGGTPTSGTGIAFPATQNASSNANTLDDYEEGTWTPSWSGGLTGVSYGSVRNGYYRKIGSVVHIWFGIMTDGLTVTSSSLSLSGLPFTAASGAGSNGTVNVWNVTRWTSSPPIVGQVELSSTLINFYNSIGATGAGTDPTSVTTGNMATTAGNRNICFGSATYSV